jgi:hypothetical protein
MRAVALRVIAAGLLATFVVGLWNVREDSRSSPDPWVELTQQYPASFVNLWVRGCVRSGESDAYCRCAINVYTTRLRTDEFETVSAVALSGGQLSELPENIRDALESVERDCR